MNAQSDEMNIGPVQPIVSVPEFKKLSDTDRRLVYMAAYKALQSGHVRFPNKRRELLRQYETIAEWSEQVTAEIQAAAVTPAR